MATRCGHCWNTLPPRLTYDSAARAWGTAMTTLALCVSVVLVLANFFFVASEFALVKVRRTRLVALAANGSRRARTALLIAQRLDVYLSANQLGITLASLGLGWLGEPALASLLAPHLSGLGAWAGVATHGFAAALALVLITTVHGWETCLAWSKPSASTSLLNCPS